MNNCLMPFSCDGKQPLEECPPEYKGIFLPKFWTYEKLFINEVAAFDYLKTEEIWVKHEKRSFTTSAGYKEIYQCNYTGVKRQCPASKCLFFPFNKPDVVVFQSTTGHEHNKPEVNIPRKILPPLDPKLKTRAEQLVEMELNMNNIMEQLKWEGFTFNERQLKCSLKHYVPATDFEKIQDWEVEGNFDHFADVANYLNTQKIWNLQSTTSCHVGIRYHYRCNLVPEKGPQCAAKMFFFHKMKSTNIVLYKRNVSHTHDSIITSPNTTTERLSGVDETPVPKPINVTDIPMVVEIPAIVKKKQNIVPYSQPTKTDASSVEVVGKIKRKTLFRRYSWTLDKTFDSMVTATAYISNLKTWSKLTITRTKQSFKQYYYCNLAKRPGCSAKIYLLRLNNTTKIRIFRNNEEHSNHLNLNVSTIELVQNNQSTTQNVVVDEIPIIDLSDDDDPIPGKDPDCIEIIAENTGEWIVTSKFKDLQMASKYLENISMNPTYSEINDAINFDFYTCGLDPLNACLVTKYTNEMSEVLLFKKNEKTIHHHDTIMSSLPETLAIESWLNEESFIPATGYYDKPFVANYNVDNINQTFQCFITTKRLVRLALNSRILHVDYNSSLNWRTCSMIILGTTDMNQTFHSFGICITPNKSESDYEFAFRSLNKAISDCLCIDYNPEVLVCNSVSTIQNAFKAVYENTTAKIIICHEFMLQDVATSLAGQDEALISEVIDDLDKIQKVHTAEAFFNAILLFTKKWSEETNFFEYYKKTWVYKNDNWYSGYAGYAPTTNKAIVAECNRINDECKFKLYCTFNSLKLFVFNIVESWTNTYRNQTKAFAQKPAVPIALYEEAKCWITTQNNIDIQGIDADTAIYYVPNEKASIGPNHLQKYKSKLYSNLEEFFNVQFSFWEIREKEGETTCNCPYFYQHYVCKHSLALADALSIHSSPTVIIDNCEAMDCSEEIL